MYPKYFGLKEPSFSIAPDPHYLFLSEKHREALAHLLYGAGEGGGFVLLTGEVGTGKTTICRAFLEQLPDGVDVALIMNPAQTANELLLSICDEFRISVPQGKLSNKTLVDRLNQYLLESHSRGHRPVLIIDEAQNLRPQVMEQIRLLTNLETTKHKLLQIFLIGQPELRRLLESDRLRQLNQRITARFHLLPFDLIETGDYIRHRVAVGGVDRPLFTASAIRLIYRYSGGIPRLINIHCDRALLGACVTRATQVTPAIVAKAAKEVRGDAYLGDAAKSPARLAFLAAGSFVAALGVGWWGYNWMNGDPTAGLGILFERVQALAMPDPGAGPDAEPAPVNAVAAGSEKTEPSTASDQDGAARPQERPTEAPPADPALAEGQKAAPGQVAGKPADAAAAPLELADFEPATVAATLAKLAMPDSEAMQRLLPRWGINLDKLGKGDPCFHLGDYGLACEQETGKLSNVRFFNLPVLMKATSANGERRFLVLTGLSETEATLATPDGLRRLPAEALRRIWTGDYTLVWQTAPGGSTVIGPGSFGEDVRWLRQLLSKLPGSYALPSDAYSFDASMGSALRAFQASKGLMPDGVAGARTLIQLHHAVGMPGVPRLDRPAEVPQKTADTP